MSKNKTLVIVESPGKIKKLESILGPEYIVLASVGHIIDLPEKTLSIAIDNDFKPSYAELENKKKVIFDLKRALKSCTNVLLATDEDREGEMIAWSLAYVLGLKNPNRITFTSITKDEILKAVKNPRKIDYDLVDAQKTRRILDRIVGYEISPILWKSIGQSLSAGRVQSVVTRLIVDREKEIEEFFKSKSTSYFTVNGIFIDKKKLDFDSQLYTSKKQKVINEEETNEDEPKVEVKMNEKEVGTLIKGGKAIIETKADIVKLFKKMSEGEFKISGVGMRESQRYPAPPFTTSSLQQEAGRKLGFAIKRTMMAAQNLYEAGHITYMRTDSVNLSKEALESIEKYVLTKYGKKYSNPKNYKAKTANAQEAHEAVRPTHVENETVPAKNKISSDEIRLYQLIWKRATASQMTPAIFDIKTTQITNTNVSDYYFQTVIHDVKFNGFLAVYNLQNVDVVNNSDEIRSISLPDIGSKILYSEINSKESWPRPPTRFNETSLVKKLDPDELNIGRPATYASIITKIQDKEYVTKMDHPGIEKPIQKIQLKKNKITEDSDVIVIGKENGKLTPTNMGKIVTGFLMANFPGIMDYKFTAAMEVSLDEIAAGKKPWVKLMELFYKDFHKTVTSLLKNSSNIMDANKRSLGMDGGGNEIIATVRKYGPVVLLINKESGKTLNIAPVKVPLTLDSITKADAEKLFAYPKLLGRYNRYEVKLYRGKYGLYAKYGDENISLNSVNVKNDDEITLEMVIKLIEDRNSKYLWAGKEGKIQYLVMDGKYGRYINITDKSKKTSKPLNIKLDEGIDPKTLTLDLVKKIVEEGKINKYKKKIKGVDDKTKPKETSIKSTPKETSIKSTPKETSIKSTPKPVAKKPTKKK
jgi:DNA topoisomerase-1